MSIPENSDPVLRASPSDSSLLQAWELGRDERGVARALRLLAAAEPDVPLERLAGMSLGRRDERLLAMRAGLFGRRLEAIASCPACGDPLEMVLDTEDLRATAHAGETEAAAEWRELPQHGVRVRPPSSADLLAATAAQSSQQAVAALVERCVQPAGVAVSDEALHDIEAAILAVDPLAEIELALECPVCGNTWVAPLDIAAFLWDEVDAWARRTLLEVHALAAAYGWSEGEILALPARRRQLYLEMVGA